MGTCPHCGKLVDVWSPYLEEDGADSFSFACQHCHEEIAVRVDVETTFNLSKVD